MSRFRTASIALPCLLSLLLILFCTPLWAQPPQSKLGRVEFQVTGSPKAKAAFIRGLAALHSFWFEEALEAFRESTKADPNFVMGYWGEAMAHNHPLWSEQDLVSARKVLAKITDTSKITARERMYVEAVRTLYGEGDKLERDHAYSEAMEKVYLAFPDDLEAASLYSLSLLGLVRPGDKGFRYQAKAGALALDVYQKNPNHPGAAHYIIHAFDDPEHAIIALPAARRYAQIAPEAHHARHMPSHIFLQLGMWPEAAASNESAWQVSNEWVQRKQLPLINRDYHSLHWLMYVYLQQGRFNQAERLLKLQREVMQTSPDDSKLRPGYYINNYANMAASFIIETESWRDADGIFAAIKAEGSGAEMGAHGAHGASDKPTDATGNTLRRSNRSQMLPLHIRGLAAAKAGSANAEQIFGSLQEIRKSIDDPYAAKVAEIRELEVAAVIAASRKDYDRAIELMKRATNLEEEMSPPSGPPTLIKPSHELLGELFLLDGKPAKAAKHFAVALLRQPNRARSLLGAARAAAQQGETKAAAELYTRFAKQWQQADANLPELREAQDYLKQATAR